MEKGQMVDLRRLRELSLMSRAEVARLINVSEATLAKWEDKGLPNNFFKVIALLYLYDVPKVQKYLKKMEELKKLLSQEA